MFYFRNLRRKLSFIKDSLLQNQDATLFVDEFIQIPNFLDSSC